MGRFLRYVFLFILSSFSCAIASRVDIDVYNVGQGNCVLAKFTSGENELNTDPKYMLVDIGSSSHKAEMALRKVILSRDKDKKETTPERLTGSSSPPSVQEHADKRDSEDFTLEEGEEATKEKQASLLIQKLRKKLERKRTSEDSDDEDDAEKTPISIHTVVITHPDKDHYGWLKTLFSEDEDHIEQLIFGGLPAHYDFSGKLELSNWVDRLIKVGTKVHFPAIDYNPLCKAMAEVLPPSEPETVRTYAPHRYSTPESKIEEFGEAFDFGDEFNVDLLSVNPTHVERNGEVVRLTDVENDNVDSLVLKIAHGKSSAILTGDATGVTTDVIINNYHRQKDFLKTNVLLASHHGSSSHGSNNEAWIRATQPEIVLISNGLSQGHPHEDAYQVFKTSKRLIKAIPTGSKKGFERHEVDTPDGRRDTSYAKHLTKRAIFSTLTSLKLSVALHKNGKVDVETERKGSYTLSKFKKSDDQDEEAFAATPEELEGEIVLVAVTTSDSDKEMNEGKGTAAVPMEAEFFTSPGGEKKTEASEEDMEVEAEAVVEDTKSRKNKKKKKKLRMKEGTTETPMDVEDETSSKQAKKTEVKAGKKASKKTSKAKKKNKKDKSAKGKSSKKTTKERGKKRKAKGEATAQGVAKPKKRRKN